MKTWIKFCGTTSLDDALASVDAGADALGFIFAPSKRRISPEQAQKIVSKLPPRIERIGVFLKYTLGHLEKMVREVGLTGVQIYCRESTAKVHKYFTKHGHGTVRIVQCMLVDEAFAQGINSSQPLPADTAAPLAGELDAWLLDSGMGSGKTFDWHAARKELGEWRGRLIIAGGLNPKNVGEAMKVFHPWGVDVVSGIECEPGRKDPQKMKAFVAAVRKAETQ